MENAHSGLKIDEARAARRSHWTDDILPGTFTIEQMERRVELFGKRQKQGFAPRRYFRFYANVLRHMVAAAAKACRRETEDSHATVDAVTRVVMLKGELASAAHMHSAREEAAPSAQRGGRSFRTRDLQRRS